MYWGSAVIAAFAAPTLIALAIAAALGAAGGYAWEHRARLAEVAEIRADIARSQAAAADDARRRIESAYSAMDAALAEKDRRVYALDATNRRLRYDLKTTTTGRPCLSAGARWLLHDAPAFQSSPPAGFSLAASAAPAADPGQSESSDADVSGWIINAAGLYEQCRARIDAIRQWDAGVSDGR